jgi:hypothetical protein
MNRKKLLAVATILIVLICLVTVISYVSLSNGSSKPFYVGVTYCGNSTAQAQQLIDKVKDYTNLFVVQSGPLMNNLTSMTQICDYAVNSGLNIIVYYAYNGDAKNTYASFLNISQTRWGSNFLGLYFNDEPGGKMLDTSVALYDSETGKTVSKGIDGSIYESYSSQSNDILTHYNYAFYSSGEIETRISANFPDHTSISNSTVYSTNGTISHSTTYVSANGMPTVESTLRYQPDGVVQDENNKIVTNKGDISQFEPYQQVWDSRPLQTYAEAADLFVKTQENRLSLISNQSDVKLFTSDYALYWYDYQAGYDTVWAQLGWNNNPAQEIALVRGAANLQNKNWGTIITWTTTDYPSLPSGDQMYEAMRQSYKSGAQYVVVFNYTPENDPLKGINANGTKVEGGAGLLEDEHYEAIERFWNEEVQNPSVVNSGAKAEAALVLPENFGWGIRNQNDNIWGLWSADSASQQIWTKLQSLLEQYGSKLDIVYENPAYPIAGKYSDIFYWNQTG